MFCSNSAECCKVARQSDCQLSVWHIFWLIAHTKGRAIEISVIATQNAEFFAWHSDESALVEYRNSCWCKTALQSENKIDQQGVISGETECDGEVELYVCLGLL